MSVWILRYQKKNKSLYFFKKIGIFVSFQKQIIFFLSFPISYTSLHVISYNCKYVLFHLNMLRLFQEINMFFSLKLNQFLIKNSLENLIPTFNPTCLIDLMFIHPNCFQIFNELKTKN